MLIIHFFKLLQMSITYMLEFVLVLYQWRFHMVIYFDPIIYCHADYVQWWFHMVTHFYPIMCSHANYEYDSLEHSSNQKCCTMGWHVCTTVVISSFYPITDNLYKPCDHFHRITAWETFDSHRSNICFLYKWLDQSQLDKYSDSHLSSVCWLMTIPETREWVCFFWKRYHIK